MNQVNQNHQTPLQADAFPQAPAANDVNEHSAVKVSIIIPVYNTAEYLPQCLDSAINQTLKDIEIIVIDDASSDNSLQIIRDYERLDKRIKVIAFAENQGNGYGRNEAIRQATGSYLMFLDSDDWLDENAAEIIYHKAISQAYDVVIYGHLSHYNYLQRKITRKMVCLPSLKENDPNFFKYLMQQRKGLNCTPWQYLVSREIVIEKDILFSEGIYFEDVIFTLKVAYHAKTSGVLTLPMYNYRRRDGSITSTPTKKKIADTFISLEIVKDFLEAEGILNQYYREYLIRFLMHGIAYNFLDYFGLPRKEHDKELDDYMSQLRKSRMFSREYLLLLNHAISELSEEEILTKRSYVLCYRILSSLANSYQVFRFNYKLSYGVNRFMRNISTSLRKLRIAITHFHSLHPNQKTKIC